MKEICEKRAMDIAKAIADHSQAYQIEVMEGENLVMQGMIFQNLSAFMLASTMKVASELKLNQDRFANMIDDTLVIALEMYKKAKLVDVKIVVPNKEIIQ